MSEPRKIRLTQVRSAIGFDRRQRATLRGLGIRHHQQSVQVVDTPEVRGMIAKVIHLVKVED